MTKPPRTLMMAILNVTPDSFSDGGRWLDPEVAVAYGWQLLGQGADILDIGGESSRPGSKRLRAEEEISRVLPVIRALAAGQGRPASITAPVVMSLDTMNAETARVGVENGVRIINDVSGALADPAILDVAAETGADLVLQHWLGGPHTMEPQADPSLRGRQYVQSLLRELSARVDAALAAGVAPERIILDPGLGFAKTNDQCWAIMRHLDLLIDTGMRVLIGASRKRFLAPTTYPEAAECPVERDRSTAAVTTVSALAGAWAVRCHEVPGNLDATRVAERINHE